MTNLYPRWMVKMNGCLLPNCSEPNTVFGASNADIISNIINWIIWFWFLWALQSPSPLTVISLTMADLDTHRVCRLPPQFIPRQLWRRGERLNITWPWLTAEWGRVLCWFMRVLCSAVLLHTQVEFSIDTLHKSGLWVLWRKTTNGFYSPTTWPCELVEGAQNGGTTQQRQCCLPTLTTN